MADNKELKTSTEAKRQKKAERRDAKAARKEANKVEEKKTRPNNIVLAVLIFGVVIAMFAFAAGYNYFQKPASIEKYIADNGGEESYGSLYIDEHTSAAVTAEGNSMKLDVTVTPHEGEEEEFKELYTDDDSKENFDYIGAYFLTTMKPEVRGFGGNVSISVKMGDEELYTKDMTYNEAKKFIKELQEKQEEEAEDAAQTEGEDEESGETDGE